MIENKVKPTQKKKIEYQRNDMALPSFVLGILGFLIPFIGFMLAILAIIFGVYSLHSIRIGEATKEEKGYSVAGLVLGIMVVSCYLFVGFILFF